MPRSTGTCSIARGSVAALKAGAADWQFSSAGLKDKHVGDTADPRSIEACAQRGYDLSAFRCREISAADFARHDLILAMDRDNLAQLEEAFALHGRDIACVMIEPIAGNMNFVRASVPFVSKLRELCTKHGALLIFDEVMTGFRVALGSAQSLYAKLIPGFAPDMSVFGKVIGGGMPLAAIGGRADVMDLLAPLGPVYQAGTLSGNPLATAAGIATLRLADINVYAAVDAVSSDLQAAVNEALFEVGVPHLVQSAGSLFTVFFGDFDRPITDYAAAQRQDSAAFARFFHAMLDAGVALPPSGYEAWFLSAAHDDAALNRIVEALPGAARAALGAA